MGKQLVLLGGGHAHMTVMRHIPEFVDRGHEVTVVGPSVHHYYSGMGPGMLGGTYAPEAIRFNTREQVTSRGGTFLLDRAVKIDGDNHVVHLASGKKIPYDVLSCNTGSHVPSDNLNVRGEDVFTVKPIENLLKGQQRVKEGLLTAELRIGVVGGGPAALEVAGNLWGLGVRFGAKQPRITVFAGKRFLGKYPHRVRKLAMRSLQGRGMEIVEQGYVRKVRSGRVVLENGQSRDLDVIFLAVGVAPSLLFGESGLPTGRDGGLLVNEFLQAVDYPDIFGGGDCISFAPLPLDKVGVYAVRQNPVLKHNLMAALEGTDMIPFDPGKNYLLIFNLGNNKGIFWKNGWIWHGSWAFWLKDYIDRRFIRRFSSS